MDKELTAAEINQWLEGVWGKRAQGVPLAEFDLNRPATREEVQYLLDRYPYLQIMSTEPQFIEGTEVQFITAASGWRIHDYGQAMSASPGELLYGYSSHLDIVKEEKEKGDAGTELPPEGTIVRQAFETAVQMVLIAMQKGWPGVEIVGGHRLMQWAAWAIAQERSYLITGFEATKQEQERRERVRHQFAAQALSRLTPQLR